MNVSGIGGSFAPQAMTGASARMPPSQKMTTLFSQIDTSGTGSINQSQFTQAFQTMKPTAGFRAMGPSTVFQALNPNTGRFSKSRRTAGWRDFGRLEIAR